MNIAGGIEEDGVVTGNTYDKYGTRNPVARWFMRGFETSISRLVEASGADSIHEVGCGEGYWVIRWCQRGLSARGSDFSRQVIDLAKRNAVEAGVSEDSFRVGSIYDVAGDRDSADLIVCCEVLEHLEHPEEALQGLLRIVHGGLIVSVPQEPLWRFLNVARGRYLADLGNTPGHVQHWSTRGFVDLVSNYFQVLEVLSPTPWTMLYCCPRP